VRQTVLVRGLALATQAFNRRDLDLALASWTPDTEYCPPRQWVDAGFFKPSYRGQDGFREFVATWSDVWGSELRMEAVEMIDLGGHILLLGNLPATTVRSGVPLAEKFATVSDMDGGVTVRVRLYLDHEEALEAAGLRE
jgi:ketosteroid isomerase-like protein